MALFYFAEKLGNAYVVGCGSHEIAKFWFEVEGETHSPLSKENALKKAEQLVGYLNKSVPVDTLDTEIYGDDSNKNIEYIREMNEESERISCEGMDESKLAKASLLMALLSD